VDSGAMNTYVWVVLDGKVDEERTQSASVGGWDVSEYLKKALTWKGNQDAMGATVSSLDTSTVKEKCRLSLNLARESDPRHQSRTETLHIKSQKDTAHQSRLELTEVTLSSELYLGESHVQRNSRLLTRI
jgi:actin-related protein